MAVHTGRTWRQAPRNTALFSTPSPKPLDAQQDPPWNFFVQIPSHPMTAIPQTRPGVPDKRENLRPTPRVLNQRLWEWSTTACVLSLLCDPDALGKKSDSLCLLHNLLTLSSQTPRSLCFPNLLLSQLPDLTHRPHLPSSTTFFFCLNSPLKPSPDDPGFGESFLHQIILNTNLGDKSAQTTNKLYLAHRGCMLTQLNTYHIKTNGRIT